MKTINIKTILNIYIAQGFNSMLEFINRIEYKPIDKDSTYLIENRKDKKLIEKYIKNLLK